MSQLYPREMLSQLFEERGLELGPIELDTQFTLADTVFFASLLLEEGSPVRVAIVHEEEGASGLARVVDSAMAEWGGGGPPPAWNVLQISRCPFDPRTLAKLSRGLKYGTQLVVVGGKAPDLWIDGIARRAMNTDGGRVIRIAAPRPGVLVFEAQHGEFLRFEAGQRVAPTVNVLSSECPVRAAIGAITGDTSALAYHSPTEWVLMQLLRRMRATGAGAILAMLPEAAGERVLQSVHYKYVDTRVLSQRIHSDWNRRIAWLGAMALTHNKALSAEEVSVIIDNRAERDSAREELDAVIDDIAQLSAIDGAVLAGPHFAIYGAGYLIPSTPEIDAIKALDAGMRTTEELPRPHGARHQAAFSFAHDNPGGVAFVISEDGPVNCAFRVDDRVVIWPVNVSET